MKAQAMRRIDMPLFLTKVAVMGAVLAAALVASVGHSQAATVSKSDVTTAGLNVTANSTNATTSTYFENDGQTLLSIRTGATATTATIVTAQTSTYLTGYGNVPLSNQVVSVPANSHVLIGPFPVQRWSTPNLTVGVSLSTVTGVSTSIVHLVQ